MVSKVVEGTMEDTVVKRSDCKSLYHCIAPRSQSHARVPGLLFVIFSANAGAQRQANSAQYVLSVGLADS